MEDKEELEWLESVKMIVPEVDKVSNERVVSLALEST